jgi:hypothetical protein
VTRVFISANAPRGEVVARALRDSISGAFRQLGGRADFWLWTTDQRIGTDWRERLLAQIDISDFGMVVLDPGALRSSWVAFEAGLIASTSERTAEARLFPFLLADSAELLKGSPFEAFECALLTPEGVTKLLAAVLGAGDLGTSDAVVRERAEQTYRSVFDAWTAVVSAGDASRALGTVAALLRRAANGAVTVRT